MTSSTTCAAIMLEALRPFLCTIRYNFPPSSWTFLQNHFIPFVLTDDMRKDNDKFTELLGGARNGVEIEEDP